MKKLITGTTGYIAKRLALQLVEQDHHLICCVRDMERIPDEIEEHPNCTFIKIDFFILRKVKKNLINVIYHNKTIKKIVMYYN